MISKKQLGAGALALALAACGHDRTTGDEYADAVPDAEGLTLELRGDEVPAALAGAAAPTALAIEDFHSPSGGELAEARARLRSLNAVVVGVLARVDEVIGRQPNALPGDVRVFGPADLPAASPAATFRLTSRKRAVGRFGFRVEAKPLGAPDSAFVTVAAGDIVRANAPRARRGRGTIGIDADALRGVNAAAYPATGKLLASFVHTGERGKALAYRLVGFDADGPGTADAPFTGKIVGHRNSGNGVTRVRTTAFRDLVGPDANLAGLHDELVVDVLGWNPAVRKTRLYTLATNYVDATGRTHGDVSQLAGGAEAFWLGRACWAGDAKQYQDWVQCRWGQTGAACAAEVVAQVLAGNSARFVKDTALPGGGGTWEQACAGVATDPAPTTNGAEPSSNAVLDDPTVEATPDEPPTAMPAG